jgi:ubiquitin domain-containing protein
MLSENKQLIEAGNEVGKTSVRYLSWIQELGLELKNFLCNLISGQLAIQREVLSIRSILCSRISTPLSEEPFILEDALGRVAPVHMRFIMSWAAFNAVLEIRFQDQHGLSKVRRREYILQEEATARKIDQNMDF